MRGVKKCPWAWCFSDRGWGWLCTLWAGLGYCSCQGSWAGRAGFSWRLGAPTLVVPPPSPPVLQNLWGLQEPAPALTSFSVIFSALPHSFRAADAALVSATLACVQAQSFHHFLKKSQIFSYILVAHLRIQGLQGGVESRNPQPFTILLAYLPFPLWYNGKDFLLWSCMAFPHQAPLSGVSVCLLVNCGSFALEVEFDFSFNLQRLIKAFLSNYVIFNWYWMIG